MPSACVPLPYARSNEIRFEELVVLVPPLSYSLPRGDDHIRLVCDFSRTDEPRRDVVG